MTSHPVEKNENTVDSTLSVGGFPLFVEGFGGVSLWPYIYISQLEHAIITSKFLPLLGISCTGRECGGAASKTKINDLYGRYTTKAYLCVAAHAETYATGSPELLLENTYSIR